MAILRPGVEIGACQGSRPSSMVVLRDPKTRGARNISHEDPDPDLHNSGDFIAKQDPQREGICLLGVCNRDFVENFTVTRESVVQ